MVTMLKPRQLGALPAKLKTARGNSLRHTSRGAWDTLRRRILARDKGLCLLCLAAGRVGAAREVDHRKPIAEGGTDHPSNLQSLCVDCHKAKTACEQLRRQGRAAWRCTCSWCPPDA